MSRAVLLAATLTVVASAVPLSAQAAGNRHATQSYTDYATVTRVTPQYRTIRVETPVTECWTEHQRTQQRYNRHNTQHRRHQNRRHQNQSSGGAIIGGIVGGVIGHTLGRQTNSQGARAGATIAGAIIGSTIANETSASGRHSRHTITESIPVERCSTSTRLESQEKLIGYKVQYRYRGKQHTVTTVSHPGNRLPIEVSIRPKGVL